MRSVILILVTLLAYVHGVKFFLAPNSMKCLKEEVQAHVLVAGEYAVSRVPDVVTQYVVRDSKGDILSKKDDIPPERFLKFSFALENYDTFEICFTSHVQQSLPEYLKDTKQEIFLVTKRGIEAKNYEGLGEVSKLKPSEIELRRLEDLSKAIVLDFARMRKNEEEMRDTNEATNRRVMYFSILSMTWLMVLSVYQVLYLRSFFKAKKLIE